MALKQLTLADLERQGRNSPEPIWVLNTAAESVLEYNGEVLMEIASPNGGKPARLKVEQTWLPQDITRQVPRARILQSIEFRSALNNKLIMLIDNATATKIRNQEGAAEEEQRLAQREREIRAAGAARTIADSGATITNVTNPEANDDEDESGSTKTIKGKRIDINDSVADAAKAGVEDIAPGVSVNFNAWVEQLAPKSDIITMNEIKSRRKFTFEELQHLSKGLDASKAKSRALVKKHLGE